MWIFTSVGFFSIVQKDNTEFLTVRSRVRKDLDRLRQKYMPKLGATIDSEGTDYPFRATISHDEFAVGMARMAYDVDYDNFKSMVYRKFGELREEIYGKVWGVLFALTRMQTGG